MCFSADADLVGSVVIGAIGVDVLRNVRRRHDHWAFAALPLLFALVVVPTCVPLAIRLLEPAGRVLPS